jgi:hypothetical protein
VGSPVSIWGCRRATADLRARILAVLFAAATVGVPPQGLTAQFAATVRVEEPAGIRRTSFPTRARLEIPAGRLPAVSFVRLEDDGSALPLQAAAISLWPDGSVRDLEIDFNLSMAPFESKSLELRYGADTLGDTAEVRGLALTEDEISVQSGRVRLGKSGSPLFLSIGYREELVGAGRNGVVVTDREGVDHDASEIEWGPVQVLKPGPLVVHLVYAGALTLGGATVPVRLDVEMPSSKSWVKLTVTAEDPEGRVRDVGIATALALGAHPWSWDWGTSNATYGAFRDGEASMVLTQTVDAPGEGSWLIRTGPRGEERPYEESAPSSPVAAGSGHLQSGREAVAFAVEGIGVTLGELNVAFDGSGQTTFRFGAAEPNGSHRLALYQHYVSTPVSIGAATSPASILAPLSVSIEP